MASLRIIEWAEHYNYGYIFEIDSFPKVVILFDRCLTKDGKNLAINKWLNLISVDIVVGDVGQIDSAMLIWIGELLHAKMSVYLFILLFSVLKAFSGKSA